MIVSPSQTAALSNTYAQFRSAIGLNWRTANPLLGAACKEFAERKSATFLPGENAPCAVAPRRNADLQVWPAARGQRPLSQRGTLRSSFKSDGERLAASQCGVVT
jgi:hypothetical protein